MGKYRIALAVLLVTLNSASLAYETEKQIIKFPLSTASKPVTFSFTGAVFNDENAPVVSKSSKNEINIFIYKIIKTNISKDSQAILKLWSPDERNKIKELVNSSSNLERNSAFFRNVQSSKLMGYIEYGNFIICYVRHKVKGMSLPYLKSYPLVLIGKELLQTNKLSDDLLFSKLGYDLGAFIWPN